MSLRTRLILAFFLLSVVPLGAVTFYSYTNNVRRAAAMPPSARPICWPASSASACSS